MAVSEAGVHDSGYGTDCFIQSVPQKTEFVRHINRFVPRIRKTAPTTDLEMAVEALMVQIASSNLYHKRRNSCDKPEHLYQEWFQEQTSR